MLFLRRSEFSSYLPLDTRMDWAATQLYVGRLFQLSAVNATRLTFCEGEALGELVQSKGYRHISVRIHHYSRPKHLDF
ncbi:MAG: hypothetical protein ACM3ZE_08185, partial [Myxococcales bacterium]